MIFRRARLSRYGDNGASYFYKEGSMNKALKIGLGDHFTFKKLIRFTLPSVAMMVFTSIYSVIDGLFVANFVGSNALSSINIVAPLIMILGAIGFMLGTGGGAEVAKTLGSGDREKANKSFSLIIYTIIVIGIVVSIVFGCIIRPVSYLFGASDLLIEDCVIYGTILLVGMTAFMLQTSFQTFFVVAEKPHFGLILTLVSGCSNILLDFLFVYVFQLGVKGAALATIVSYVIGGVVPIFYFAFNKKSILRFCKTKLSFRLLGKSSYNGLSEMLTNISMAVVSVLFNLQLMKMVGEDGVAAISILNYVNFIFVAIFLGFSMGASPIVGYHYGAQNKAELRNMFRKCLTIISIVSLAMFGLSEALAEPIVWMFVRDQQGLTEMATRGFRLNAIGFLFCGINIYGSSFYTSLCNGGISATISTLRSLVFPAIFVFLLPLLFGLDGVWTAVAVGEVLTCGVTIIVFSALHKKYGYGLRALPKTSLRQEQASSQLAPCQKEEGLENKTDQ